MKQTLILFITFGLASIIAACTHIADAPQPAPNDTTLTTGGNNGGGDTTINSADTSLCFERDILPIFISNCAKAGCHDAASAEEGYVFTSYQTITAKKFKAGNAAGSELYKKITDHDEDDIMPPPPNDPLTEAQISLIRRWIDSGAPNTTDCGNGGCDSMQAGFAAVIQPMLDANCKGCHNANLSNGGVRLDNYAGVAAAAATGQLLGVVRHDPGFTPMPQGGNKLDNCQIAQIARWIANGRPND